MPKSRWDRGTWLLLLLLAVLSVAFPLLDVAGIARAGIPSDHAAAYSRLAGESFSLSGGPSHYIRQLEVGYAPHELTFGLFFAVIVAIPLRVGQRWAWWACWISEIANLGYLFTFARFSSTTLVYALIPAVGIPVLLLAQTPRLWFRDQANAAR